MTETPQSMDQHDALMEDSCEDTMREEEESKSFGEFVDEGNLGSLFIFTLGVIEVP